MASAAPVAISLVLSSLHLGRKHRAWRAVLNIRRSWLSREIVLYSSFLGLSAASPRVRSLRAAAAA